jgi:hypothetical protein
MPFRAAEQAPATIQDDGCFLSRLRSMTQLLWSVLGLTLLLGLPLIGVWVAGQPVSDYLAFPPKMLPVPHAPFSWPIAIGLALAIGSAIMPFLLRITRERSATVPNRPATGAWPWWGWIAVAWTLGSWAAAWTRAPWMEPVQAWTFTPLWCGYIVLVNAVTVMRGGTSLLLARPVAFAVLFPISSAFWWLFEYLNRFVQNWYYGGVAELSAADYLLQASIPFSTVLPAVISTYCLVATAPRIWSGLDQGPPVRVRRPRRWAAAVLCLSALALLGLGIWPDVLFPFVWIAPAVLIVCLQTLAGRPTIFEPVHRGDWRPLWSAAVASLVCGLFWELWNWGSLAHWSYTIPYVDRFHVFAMPLLGYAGYLPFGLECLIVADLVLRDGTDRPIVDRPFPW